MITERTYILASISWPRNAWASTYPPSLIDELRINVRTDEGWFGDFGLQWHLFPSGNHGIRLCAFDDSWKAMLLLAPMFDALNSTTADAPRAAYWDPLRDVPAPEEVIAILEESFDFKPDRHHGQLAQRKA